MEKLPITVLIAAKNEEKNMHDCLRSISWADQVFVLDSQSTDKTIEISESYGAEVAQFFYDGGWPKKRNWGLETLPIRNDWVLLLDADERITPELKKDLEWAIQQKEYNGFYLKWQFIFLGKWMKYSWSHGWMMRFFKLGKGAYEDLGMRGEGGWDAEVHENVVVEGKCGKLEGLLEHNSHEDLFFWIKKQNEFSTWNAKRRLQQTNEPIPPFKNILSGDPSLKRRYLKSIFLKLPLKHVWMFIYLYFFKFGFLDGKAGYYFCWLRSMHELNIQAKVYELSLKD
jgi:glycosyltransferase involved in cell wall biosynthesis